MSTLKPPPEPELAPQSVKEPKGAGKKISSLKRRLDGFFSQLGQHPNPIVPRSTVVGRSLVLVTAIMCFLACLALGTAWAVHRAAATWTRDAGREITIQIKPVDGVELKRQVRETLSLLSGIPGIVRARAYSNEDTLKILEPWLGKGLNLDELPVPQLIALELDPVVPPDLKALENLLKQKVPNAVLDDHRVWQAQIRSVARSIQLASFLVLFLMLGATLAIIVFATKGAMAGNKDIVEVLHMVGARQRFIAGEFARHFLILGLKGGAIGGIAAAGMFIAARMVMTQIITTSPGGASGALVQAVSIGWAGYAGIAGIVALLGVLSAVTSRMTVSRYLRTME